MGLMESITRPLEEKPTTDLTGACGQGGKPRPVQASKEQPGQRGGGGNFGWHLRRPLICPARGLRVVGGQRNGDDASLHQMVETSPEGNQGLRDAPTRFSAAGCDAADGRLVDTSGFGHGVLAVPLRSEV